MLTHLKIKDLFHLYSYDMDVVTGQTPLMHFITGPNGYGKTTILQMVHALYTREFEFFLSLPFSAMEAVIDDALLTIERGETRAQMADGGDVEIIVEQSLTVSFSETGTSAPSVFTLSKNQAGEVSISGDTNPLELFMNSRTCYYITDQRLAFRKSDIGTERLGPTDSRLVLNAAHLKTLLQSRKTVISGVLSPDAPSISKELYQKELGRLSKELLELESFGLIPGTMLLPYSDELAHLLGGYIVSVEKQIDIFRPLVERLRLFKSIIDSSDLADKELQINPRYGYRFTMKDEYKTILLPDSLSSGEKHLLVQAYEMIFMAQEGTLLLVDEPEISYHVAWQVSYLNNLAEITKMRRMQCITATHSPEIFSSRWDLTTDLFENKQNDE